MGKYCKYIKTGNQNVRAADMTWEYAIHRRITLGITKKDRRITLGITRKNRQDYSGIAWHYNRIALGLYSDYIGIFGITFIYSELKLPT